jgi:predicted RND superfamily exporter protein
MSLYGNKTDKYSLPNKIDGKRILKLVKHGNVTNSNSGGLSIKEFVDTISCTIRIRCQIKDLGAYEVVDKVKNLEVKIDSILNPCKNRIYEFYNNKQSSYIDSIFQLDHDIADEVGEIYKKKYPDQYLNIDNDPGYIKKFYADKDFPQNLKTAIDKQFLGVTFTGTSIVSSAGALYLVNNLISSLIFAILSIGILMAILFRSWRMVLISMVPNLIPLIVTGGIMGYFGIALKPSTVLIFSIAFGISVDDTIHFLSKYRQELKNKHWDLKSCVLIAIRESGLGMFYTSIVLFCGFSVFAFSQFGGTQALGILISITLLVAMINNLVLLPALLLSMDKLITTKSFKEPYFEAYNEDSDIDWNSLPILEENDKKIES